MTVKKTTIGTIGTSIQDFKILSQIGTGGSAEVFKAQSLKDGFDDKYFALKKIRKFRDNGRSCVQRIEREVEIHRRLQNDYIVKFYDFFEDETFGYIVLELCEHGSLQEYLKHRHSIPEDKACYFIRQVIEGVIFLHSKDIMHRDLSLKNLMLTSNNEIRIADFGLATKYNGNRRKLAVVGTVNFMAPEVFDGYYDFKTDCWSVGCILYALLYGSPPFDAKKKEDIKRHIKMSDPKFPDYASLEARELIMDMLEKDSSQRINIRDALKYSFFQKYETYKVIYRKNGDSGMSSLSSSTSSNSQPILKPYVANGRDCVKKSWHNENVSNYEYLDDYKKTQNRYSTRTTIKRNCSSQLIKSKNDSIYEDEIKNEMQNLPSCQASYISSRMNPDCKEYKTHKEMDEMSSQIHNVKFDGCITSTKNQDNGFTEKCFSNSHGFGNSEMNSFHKRSDFYHSSKSNAKESKILQLKNTQSKKNLQDTLTPLITKRLKRRRSRMNNFYFSILNDGQFCMEILKTIKNKEYVSVAYFISHDGTKIKFFKPKSKILLSNEPPQLKNSEEVQYFTFENLPDTHRKKYRMAKVFVDMVRAKTAKVTIYEKFARCVMMENTPDPDYEIEFYNGFLITEVGGKIKIRDQNNHDVPESASNVEFMLTEFKRMKEACKDIEMYIESNHRANFPVTIGSKPDAIMGQQKANKENVSLKNGPLSSLNGTSTSMKSFNVSKLVSVSSSHNSSQKNSPSLLSNEKSVTIPYKKLTENDLNLGTFQLVGDNWVITEYKDGIQMYIGTMDEKYFFRDVNTQEKLPVNPDLMHRFHRDSPKLLRFALSRGIEKKS